MMVLQGNAQVIADIIQLGGKNIPGLPGQAHRAFKGKLRGGQPRRLTAPLQHRPVKRGIVGRQEIDPFQDRGQARP